MRVDARQVELSLPRRDAGPSLPRRAYLASGFGVRGSGFGMDLGIAVEKAGVVMPVRSFEGLSASPHRGAKRFLSQKFGSG